MQSSGSYSSISSIFLNPSEILRLSSKIIQIIPNMSAFSDYERKLIEQNDGSGLGWNIYPYSTTPFSSS